MALAQLWGDNYPMPSQEEMDREADESILGLAKLVKVEDVKITGVKGQLAFDQWVNKVAGTGLYEHLGNWANAKSWKLWWSDRKLYNTLMGGIVSAHMLRLFDTPRGRKAWPGARQAIMDANKSAHELQESGVLRPQKAGLYSKNK